MLHRSVGMIRSDAGLRQQAEKIRFAQSGVELFEIVQAITYHRDPFLVSTCRRYGPTLYYG
jgi:hypothetical protein